MTAHPVPRDADTSPPAGRPRFAMYWAASCGGCDIAVLNLGAGLLEIGDRFEVVFWPCATDGKTADVEALPDGSVALTLFSGGIRNDENERMARLLRAKSRILVAFGSCACEGCVPGLANLRPVEDILATAFGGPTTDPGGLRPVARFAAPDGVLELPTLLPTLRTLDEVVPVDYFVPGCPPETARIAEVVAAFGEAVAGRAELPPRGAVLGAGRSTVCDECSRTRDVKRIRRFVRIQDLPAVDPSLCLLEQGLPCNGPATRDGCGALCPAAGAQCIGCYGPAEGVVDFGARLMSAFASVVESDDPDEISAILDGIVDPVGQVYRFSLAGSLLGAARAGWSTRATGVAQPAAGAPGGASLEEVAVSDGPPAEAAPPGAEQPEAEQPEAQPALAGAAGGAR